MQRVVQLLHLSLEVDDLTRHELVAHLYAKDRLDGIEERWIFPHSAEYIATTTTAATAVRLLL